MTAAAAAPGAELEVEPKDLLGPALTCPNCGSTSLVSSPERGEEVCAECGLVVEDRIADPGPEWRCYGPDGDGGVGAGGRRAYMSQYGADASRAGRPLSSALHDLGLSTVIDKRDRDARGRALGAGRRAQMIRLRRWQSIATCYGPDRSTAVAMGHLQRIASLANLPRSVREEAAVIYRKAAKAGLMLGNSREAAAAASAYAACRLQGTPRSLREIARCTGRDLKEVGRMYRLIVERLGIKPPAQDLPKLIAKIARSLGLAAEEERRVERRAIEIINKVKELAEADGAKTSSGVRAQLARAWAHGKSPLSAAAAAVAAAALLEGAGVPKARVARAAGVTAPTVRLGVRDLLRALGIGSSSGNEGGCARGSGAEIEADTGSEGRISIDASAESARPQGGAAHAEARPQARAHTHMRRANIQLLTAGGGGRSC